jgi:hypothetical protein
LRAMIESDGLAAIERRLTAILVDASSAGSRDDVTLGIIKRLDENQPARDDTTENARSRAREAPPDASYLAAAPYGKASSYREDTPIAELAAPRRSAESSRSEVIRRDRLARDESRRWALRIVLIAAFALAIVAICAIAVPWPRLLHHFFHASPGTPNTAGEIAKADAILDQLDAPPPVAVDGQADSGHKVVDDTKTDQTPLLKHALELYRKAAQGDPASVKALRGERYVYERLHDWSDAARIASNVIIVDGAKAAARSDAQNDLRELIYAISGGDQSRSLHNLQLVKTLGAGFDAQSKPLRPAGSASPVPEPSSALKPAPHKTPADSMP